MLLLQAGLDDARRQFPPDVADALLTGRAPAPKGFDDAVAVKIGKERLATLRKGTEPAEGTEKDAAALVLVQLGVDPKTLPRAAPPRGGRPAAISVLKTNSAYPAAPGKTSGWFRTGQPADIALSAIGFNDAGGPLLFNHPMGIAGHGDRLLLADTYNNRVLIWNRAPIANTPPDLVLGQTDFTGGDSGAGLDRLNFPVQVATDGTRIFVADTENHRILIWNRWPTKNGQPADLALQGGGHSIQVSKSAFHWPWGLWTDGTKLAISSTRGGGVLIWNSIPTKGDQPADFVLRAGGKFGTPRTITGDGKCLIVGDHNPRVDGAGTGTFIWKRFPTKDDEPYDFFEPTPARLLGPWLRGCFAPDGRLVLLGETLHLYRALPQAAGERPALSVTGYSFRGGDHVGAAMAGGRLYVCTGNRNCIVVYNTLPERPDHRPNFAVGSPDIETDTLQTHFIISNPVPASNGLNLFVASDFDSKLYVWKRLPDKTGAAPDLVFTLPDGASAIALHKETLIVAGRNRLTIWDKLPLEGELPSRTVGGDFQDIRGIALDDRHFYLSDARAGKIHVWKGMVADSKPAFSLEITAPGRLSSDGTWLTVAMMEAQTIGLFRIDGLSAASTLQRVGGRGVLNLPTGAHAAGGHLFVAESAGQRVHVWKRVEDALDGKPADVILGDEKRDDTIPETGRTKLRYPAALCFDGSYLWVGETKFSERLLRYSPAP